MRPLSKCLIRGPGARAKVTARVFAGRLPVSHASRSSGEFIKPDGKRWRNAKKEEPLRNTSWVRRRTEPQAERQRQRLALKIEFNATRRLWTYLAMPLSRFFCITGYNPREIHFYRIVLTLMLNIYNRKICILGNYKRNIASLY